MIQSVSKVDTTTTGMPASASGLSSEVRTPTWLKSRVPATRKTTNGPSTGPGTSSGSAEVGQVTLVSSSVKLMLTSGLPSAQGGAGVPAGSRTTAMAVACSIRRTSGTLRVRDVETDAGSRGEAGDREPGRLGEVQGDVHRLEGPARRPLGQVVDRTHHDHAVGPLVDGDLQLGGVRAQRVGGPRPSTLGQHVNELLRGVRLDPRLTDLLRRGPTGADRRLRA